MKKTPRLPLPAEDATDPQENRTTQSEAEILEFWNAQKQHEAVPMPLPKVAEPGDTKRARREPPPNP